MNPVFLMVCFVSTKICLPIQGADSHVQTYDTMNECLDIAARLPTQPGYEMRCEPLFQGTSRR